jgi:hypothetical protein
MVRRLASRLESTKVLQMAAETASKMAPKMVQSWALTKVLKTASKTASEMARGLVQRRMDRYWVAMTAQLWVPGLVLN